MAILKRKKMMGEESLQVVLEIGQRVDLGICYFHIPVEVGSREWKVRLLKHSNFLFQADPKKIDFFSV